MGRRLRSTALITHHEEMSVIKLAWENSIARRNLTGTGVYAAQLLAHLKHVEGLEVEVFDGWLQNAGPGRITRGLQLLANLTWMRTSFPSELRDGGFDVLHCPAYLAPLSPPCAMVVTIHDVSYLRYSESFARRWVWLMKSMMPRVLHAAAAVICPSQSARRDVAETYALPLERVHAVLHGVDKRFQPGLMLNTAWAAGLGVRPGYILHVGELSYRKNVPTLLSAVASLKATGRWKDRQLVLAGGRMHGMKGAKEVDAVIAKLGIERDVLLAGHVPTEHLPGLYANAALLVMPSFYEGFGFPVAEAMASGTPVVCSNASSLPEVAGDAALLADPHRPEEFAQRIAEVLENATVAASLREKGLARAQLFDWRKNAEATYRVYQSVVH